MATKLVDMALTKAEIKEETGEGMVSRTGQPDPYPWGLSLSLESRELKKLGIDKMPQVGSEFHMLVVAKVTSVNMSAREGQDEESRVGLQICMMQVLLAEAADEEAKEGKETPALESKETQSILNSYKG